MSDEHEERAKFDVRSVNLTKLTKAIDCQIIIAEADFSIAQIKSQIKSGFGDSQWLEDAAWALKEIEHKKGLAELKLSSVVEANLNKPVANPQNNFAGRFYEAAREILDPQTIGRLLDRAGELKANGALVPISNASAA